MFSQKAAILGSEYIVYISSSLSRCAPILQEMSDYIQNNVCTVPRMHMEPSSSIPGHSLVLIYSEVLLQLAVLVGSLGDLFLGVLLGSGVLGEYFGLVYFLVDLHVATVETRDLV